MPAPENQSCNIENDTVVASPSGGVVTMEDQLETGGGVLDSRSDSEREEERQAAMRPLPAELLQILTVPRTVNEEGELEDLPPAEPATLAPAFSKETLDALRAERLARKAAAPVASSARPSRNTTPRSSSPAPSETSTPSKLKSHRSGGKEVEPGTERKKGRSSTPQKSNRDAKHKTKQKAVHLALQPGSQLSFRAQAPLIAA